MDESTGTPTEAGALEEALLGGRRRYTRQELAQRSGVPPERGRQLWRAMGFADVGDDERVFTDGDVEALRCLRELEESGVVTSEAAYTHTRAMGQQLARLADWQTGVVLDFLEPLREHLDDEQMTELAVHTTEQVLPAIEKLVIYVWRRQLAAVGGRILLALGEEMDSGEQTVGFADLVGYTRLTRRLSESELAGLLEAFEGSAADVIVGVGGRLVKTLGDGVLFVADDPANAAEIALRLTEAHAADDDLPDVRVGVATGAVLTRLGDVFGPVVNLASRLTSLARPGTTLIDRELAQRLAGNPAYELKPIGRQRARGYGAIEATSLRRANPPAPSG